MLAPLILGTVSSSTIALESTAESIAWKVKIGTSSSSVTLPAFSIASLVGANSVTASENQISLLPWLIKKSRFSFGFDKYSDQVTFWIYYRRLSKPWGRCRMLTYWMSFCDKLHENENNLSKRSTCLVCSNNTPNYGQDTAELQKITIDLFSLS